MFEGIGILGGIGGSCLGVLWLVFTIYAIIHVASSRVSVGSKVIWIVLMFIFPCFGPIAWFFLGPRQDQL